MPLEQRLDPPEERFIARAGAKQERGTLARRQFQRCGEDFVVFGHVPQCGFLHLKPTFLQGRGILALSSLGKEQ